METFVTVIHVFVCLFLVLVILLQAGKGAGMGVLGGAGQTVFGGRGPATFLGKMTAVMAGVFMLTSMLLAYWASHQDDGELRERAAEQQRAASMGADADGGATKPDTQAAAERPTSAATQPGSNDSGSEAGLAASDSAKSPPSDGSAATEEAATSPPEANKPSTGQPSPGPKPPE